MNRRGGMDGGFPWAHRASQGLETEGRRAGAARRRTPRRTQTPAYLARLHGLPKAAPTLLAAPLPTPRLSTPTASQRRAASGAAPSSWSPTAWRRRSRTAPLT
jgi:hypothetical protein